MSPSIPNEICQRAEQAFANAYKHVYGHAVTRIRYLDASAEDGWYSFVFASEGAARQFAAVVMLQMDDPFPGDLDDVQPIDLDAVFPAGSTALN